MRIVRMRLTVEGRELTREEARRLAERSAEALAGRLTGGEAGRGRIDHLAVPALAVGPVRAPDAVAAAVADALDRRRRGG